MILNARFVTILTIMRKFTLKDSEFVVLRRVFLVNCRRISWVSSSYRNTNYEVRIYMVPWRTTKDGRLIMCLKVCDKMTSGGHQRIDHRLDLS
jgi:hypothetical protein